MAQIILMDSRTNEFKIEISLLSVLKCPLFAFLKVQILFTLGLEMNYYRSLYTNV